MAYLSQLTSAQILQSMVEQYADEATQPAATDTGSSMGAMFEAVALLALQLQQQAVYLAQISRAATSTGADIDSFWAPFGITRIGASESSGQELITLASSPGSPMLYQVGAIFGTPGGVQFQIIADLANPAYDQSANGYYINPAPAAQSVSATVQCLQTGTIGNATANTITQNLTPSLAPGSPTVTNPLAFTNAVNTESDDAFNARATITVASGRVGNQTAIVAAILAVQAGIIYSYGDRTGTDGVIGSHPAQVMVVVNEANTGTTPTSAFLSACQAAANAVRAGGISVDVIAPTLVQTDIDITVSLQPGYSSATVQPAVQQAIIAFLNGVGLNPNVVQPAAGDLLPATIAGQYQIGAVALGVPGVADIIGDVTLNGTQNDVTAPFGYQIVARTVNVSTV